MVLVFRANSNKHSSDIRVLPRQACAEGGRTPRRHAVLAFHKVKGSGAQMAKAETTGPAAGSARRSKRESVMAKAAELIARQGFDGTSMRDIAAAVGMLPGSLYYHFASKEDLLLDIHERVVAGMTERVQAALDGVTDPWERVERAAIAHLEGLLASGSLVTIISPNFPKDRDALNQRLKAHRNAYERVFQDLFAAVEVPEGIDRRLLRLQLLGALNWVPVWYDPKGKTTPAEIARTFVRSVWQGCAAGAPRG